jgi:hypothetical protein
MPILMFLLEKPTTDKGVKCNLPFNRTGLEWFTCDVFSSCPTDLGEGTCVQGQFLLSSSESGQNFKIDYQFPTITIEKSGMYEISYYILMICSLDGCKDAGDTIEFYIDKASNAVHTYSNIERQQKWIKQTETFAKQKGRLDVNNI